MNATSEPDVDSSPQAAVQFGKTLFWFLLNLAAVYLVSGFLVEWLAGLIHNVVLPFLQIPSAESRFAFAFDHILFFSLFCGFWAGFIATRYNSSAACWVWIVPTAVFIYKFATFPSSLLQSHFAAAFHHYLSGGFLIPEFHNYREMFAGWNIDYARGMDQSLFTAPVYVGFAYSCTVWAGTRLRIRGPGLGVFVARLSADNMKIDDKQTE